MNYTYFENKIKNLKDKEIFAIYDANQNFGFGIKKDYYGYIIGEIKLPKMYYFCKVKFFFIDNTIEYCDMLERSIDYIIEKMFNCIYNHIYAFNWFNFKNDNDKLKYNQYLKDYNDDCMKIEDPYQITVEEQNQLRLKYTKVLNYIYLLFMDNLVDIINIGCVVLENEQK